MEEDKSDPHEGILVSFSYHSILSGHYYTFSSSSEEACRVVTKYKTKTERNQMPEVHGADKVVNPKHKPEPKLRRRNTPVYTSASISTTTQVYTMLRRQTITKA